MANKKDLTIEELEKQCEDAKKNFEALNEQLKQAKKNEEEHRKAKLALEKEMRQKEVDDACDRCAELLRAFVRDYGSYSSSNGEDFVRKVWRWWM